MDEKLLKHGSFCWFELMTTDVAGAKDFYKKLMGWEMKDQPMDKMTYTVVSANGDEVAGIMTMPPDAGEMPPVWGTYVTVDDVDAIAKQAVALGGKILVEPRDIPEVGRFAVVQDTLTYGTNDYGISRNLTDNALRIAIGVIPFVTIIHGEIFRPIGQKYLSDSK